MIVTSRRTGVLAASTVVLLAAVALLALWSTRITSPATAADSAVTQARTAGRQIAIDVTSYDYRKVTQQFAVVAGETTGQALTSFQSEKAQIQSYLASQKVVTVATVNTDAVVPGATRSAATILVALTLTQSADGGTPTQSTQLIKLGMVRQGSRWVAATVSGEGQ